MIPSYAHPTDAGMDMVAISKTETENYIEFDTGIAVEIPEGFVGLIFPRSSISKKDLSLCNSVGVIDAKILTNSPDFVDYFLYICIDN